MPEARIDHHIQLPQGAAERDQFCGPACVQMVLSTFGILPQRGALGTWSLQQNEIFAISNQPRPGYDSVRDGEWASKPDSLASAVNHYLPQLGPLAILRYQLMARRVPRGPGSDWPLTYSRVRIVLSRVRAGLSLPVPLPSIFLHSYGEHFVVISGFSAADQTYEIHDPSPPKKVRPHKRGDVCSQRSEADTWEEEFTIRRGFNSTVGSDNGKWSHKTLGIVPARSPQERRTAHIWSRIARIPHVAKPPWPDPKAALDGANAVYSLWLSPSKTNLLNGTSPDTVFPVHATGPHGPEPYWIVVLEKAGAAKAWVCVSGTTGKWQAIKFASGPWPTARLTDTEVLALAGKHELLVAPRVAQHLEWSFCSSSRTPFLPYYRIDTREGPRWLDWESRLLKSLTESMPSKP